MPLENAPLTIVPDDRVEEVPAPKAKTSINSLRRMLSWLEVEKGILLLTNRRQPVKGKRKKRYCEVKRQLKGKPYNLRSLSALEESTRITLRVKVLQRRRAKQTAARKIAIARRGQKV